MKRTIFASSWRIRTMRKLLIASVAAPGLAVAVPVLADTQTDTTARTVYGQNSSAQNAITLEAIGAVRWAQPDEIRRMKAERQSSRERHRGGAKAAVTGGPN
jgi:hypothetical protein